ncbi:MAG TPA: fasciclin domain-containing protein [Pirellulaceae bacterium]|nr:fasciclin domain-containing protein [Pirellulaceae bacterium]
MTSRIFTIALTTCMVAGFHSVHGQTCPSQATSSFVSIDDDKKPADIVDTAVAAGSFKTLAAALQAAGLVDALKGEGPFTVFAPTDEAFAKLPAGTIEELLKPENKETLIAILKFHVVAGNITSNEVVKLDRAKTLQGQDVKITVEDGKVHVNSAEVIKVDIGCANGVIHVIDRVIMPQ